MGGATLGQKILGCIRKQAKEPKRSKPKAAFLWGICFSSCLQIPVPRLLPSVPALTSLDMVDNNL